MLDVCIQSLGEALARLAVSFRRLIISLIFAILLYFPPIIKPRGHRENCADGANITYFILFIDASSLIIL